MSQWINKLCLLTPNYNNFLWKVNTQYNCNKGFPGGSVVKNPPANEGDTGSIFGLGRYPEEENGNPLQYSCLENSMDRKAWWLQSMDLQKSQKDSATKQQQ